MTVEIVIIPIMEDFMSEVDFKQTKPNAEKMNENFLAELSKKIGNEKILSCLILKNNHFNI